VERANKDAQFNNAQDSPIKEEERTDFEGLVYFEPNIQYITKAKYVEASGSDTLSLMTTSGAERKMIVAGAFQFKLQEVSHRLIAYRYLDASIKELFIPFKDLTSGAETYGGGRYMDIEVNPNSLEEIRLDFNKAYNPYCVYNENFVCPIPPKENNLLIEIRAGEKMKR
jgi:uncharacterized protein (DUF1684 family)